VASGRQAGDRRDSARTSRRSPRPGASRRPGGTSRRVSALARLGPKVPIAARLGGGSSSRAHAAKKTALARLRKEKPSSSAVSGEGEVDTGMQITISSKGEEGRKVAREVDMENYTTVDQVGDVEAAEKEAKAAREAKEAGMTEAEIEEGKERERKIKDRLVREDDRKKTEEDKLNVDLDKIVIKKLDKRTDEKSGDEKILVVKTPNNLIAKLAEKKKEFTNRIISPESKSDEEKTDIRKKFKEKYQSEERLPEKIINMALESVFHDEQLGEELISKLLEDEKSAPSKTDIENPIEEDLAPPPPLPIMDEHELDFEAEDTEEAAEETEEVAGVEESEETVEQENVE